MVDLPDPERPTSATVFPSGISRLILRSAAFATRVGKGDVLELEIAFRPLNDPRTFVFSCSESRIANSVWHAAIPRWNWALTLVSDFSGRISAIIEEKTTVMVPAVRVSITLGKLAAYRTKASAGRR